MAEKSQIWVAVLKTLHQSSKVNAVSIGAEVLYRRLLEVCDDKGNYFADPGLILAYVFGHRLANQTATVKDVESWRDELVAVKLATIYDDGKCLHLVNHYTKFRSDRKGFDIRFTSFDPTRDAPVTDTERPRNGHVTRPSQQRRVEERRGKETRDFAPGEPDAGDVLTKGLKTLLPKPDPKPRMPTPQQERLKTMADAYFAAYLDVTGKELTGKSIKSLYSAVGEWDKAQPLKAAGLLEWTATIPKLAQAHKLDKTFHPFPTSIYKLTNGWSTYCTDLWLDGAKANAAKRVDADPKIVDLKRRATRCMNSSDGASCRVPLAPNTDSACFYCRKTVQGSKR